jgi:urease accessory protein
MGWKATLNIDYSLEEGHCVARHMHDGPLRILKSLYPEGDAVCHNILVHPPSGLVGGDELHIDLNLHDHAHALVTTPGATRFYHSDGQTASQYVSATLGSHSRLEWLPLEALAYSGCQAHNQVKFHMAPDSQLMAWDVTALGLPHADQPFVQGQFQQHLEIEGLWLERGLMDAKDHRLLHSPLGLNGHSCQATLVFAQGSAMPHEHLQHVIELARSTCQGHLLELQSGVTSPDPRLVVVRVLSAQVEQAMALIREIWLRWRSQLWTLPSVAPRIWAT